MKKLKFIAIATVVLFMSACSSFVEDYDVSPNSPSEVTPALLLSNAQVATFATYQGQLARLANMMTQQLVGTDFQMLQQGNYTLLEGDHVNEWDVLYNDIIQSTKTLREEYGEGNPYYFGMANVLEALALGIATDFWGDIPASDAADGLTGNYEPTWDSQEAVIARIQSLLDEAITNFGKGIVDNAAVPGGDDLIGGGDIASWTMYANMIKARYSIRLTKKDETKAATDALAALTAAGLTGNGDDMLSAFGAGGNELNPWDAFENSRGGYLRMSSNLVNVMTGSSDPRLPFYAGVDTGGAYSGTDVGVVNTVTSPIGTYLRGTTGDLISYVECKFIEAEAQIIKGDKTAAAAAHNDAVKAHVEKITGGADSAFYATNASEDGSSISLEKIMNSKWVAMFGQAETWADWRRTNFPTLTANPSGDVEVIPRRLVTPLNERLYNNNAPANTDITAPVWWDM